MFRQNISSVSFREALKCKNISNFLAHAVGQTTKPLHISMNSLKIFYFRIRKSFIRKSGELERKVGKATYYQCNRSGTYRKTRTGKRRMKSSGKY